MEVLLTAWRSENAFRPAYRHPTFTQRGLELGAGTVIVPAANDNGDSLLKIDGEEERILALLSVAYNRPLLPALLKHLRNAARCWSRGDSVSAMIHIAFTGLPGLEKDGAFRLFLADRLLQDGLDQGEVLKGLGLLPQGLDPWEWRRLAKYNDKHVPAGCPEGGQFCSAEGGAQSGAGKIPKDVQKDIAERAKRYKESEKWLYDDGKSKSYKCNIFVADVLREAGVPVDGVHRTFRHSYPPTAGDWGNVDFKIPGWEIVDAKDAKPGDIIAMADWWNNPFYSSGASGHVGIVVDDRQTASSDATVEGTSKGKITVSDWGFRSGQIPVVRRYVGRR